jgi:hypothetical protein
MSAYPFCAALSVDKIAGAAGCDGDAGKGAVRVNTTSDRSVPMIAGRNGAADISSFGEGVEPVDASATSLVKSCVISLLATVSTSRAVSGES